jgi:hypothetical protein
VPILGTIASSYDLPTTRALFAGGRNTSSGILNTIDYITVETTGNATNFGSLTQSRLGPAGCSSSTRGLFGGGSTDSGNTGRSNVIDYVTIASTGNATDFGDLTVARFWISSCSSSTRGIWAGGESTTDTRTNTIDYITIASIGNATNFGSLTVARQSLSGLSSSTRGVFGGGSSDDSSVGFRSNVIDYVTIATTGNATDFGDLTSPTRFMGACSSSTRGIFAGGQRLSQNMSSGISYVTIASTGNATEFGDLTQQRYILAGTSSSITGVFAGGYNISVGDRVNTIDYITIATTGGATDFGDLTTAREGLAACSSGHGGL